MSLPFNLAFSGLSSGLQTKNAAASGGVGGWVELGRTTLGSASSTINVTSLADKKYYMYLIHGFIGSRWMETRMKFNSDTGSNYAYRISQNGSADGAGGSASNILIDGEQDARPRFQMGFVANKSDKEKLLMGWSNIAATGAATAPGRNEQVNKWANTSSSINAFNIFTSDPASDNYGAGSEVVVLGWDPADTHTNNFWTELASVNATGSSQNLSSGTITAKKYLWVQVYCKGHTGDINMKFNNDTAGNYARRYSSDGAGDVTNASQTSVNNMIGGGQVTPCFTNFFIINNSANEKLIIGHDVSRGTAGAANAPHRLEFVSKWANTSAQITEIDVDSTATNFSSDSMIKVYGSN